MRSAVIVTAAFAAAAFGTPLKRDLIVETDTATHVDYVTDLVTVTEGEVAPATSAVAAITTTVAAPAVSSFHWGHHSWHHASSAPAASTSEAPAPAAPSSSSEAAPAPSSYSAPAPESSSSEAAPAPSSAPATSSSSVAATSASAAAAATASTYQQAVLDHHNFHRANHSAPALVWDNNMATLAAEIASTCYYAHNMSLGTYGQNIAAGIQSTNISYVISDMFYDGEVNAFNGLYGQSDPTADGFENWGHFSQIVWKGTTSVGCATAYCNGKNGLENLPGNDIPPYFTVCNYSPPGNYAGEYGANIGNSLNQPTVTFNKAVASPYLSSNGQGGVSGNGVSGLVGSGPTS